MKYKKTVIQDLESKLLLQEKIIEGLKIKDRIATEYLYNKYSRALCGVISRIHSDPEILEEVFHDSFIQITRTIESYDESKGHFYSWMAIICRNCPKNKSLTNKF